MDYSKQLWIYLREVVAKPLPSIDMEDSQVLDKLVALIKKKCPIAWKNFLNNKEIYRGTPRDNSGLAYYINPQRRTRKSANTHNFYTLLIDHAFPEWSEFPKRSKSLICSSSKRTASCYGEVYIVFPMGDPKVGICSNEDFWYSFPNVNKYKNLSGGELDSFNRSIYRISQEYGVEPKYSNISELLSWFDELTRKVKSDPNKTLKNQPDADILQQDINETSMYDIYRKVLNPQDSEVRLQHLSNLEAYENREMWLSAPSILVHNDSMVNFLRSKS